MTQEESMMNRSLHGLLNEVIGYHGGTPSNVLGINIDNLWQNNNEPLGSEQQNYFDQILQFLIQNDSTQVDMSSLILNISNFGSPPASLSAIERSVLQSSIPSLKAAEGLKQCSICQQNYQFKDIIMKMPCDHYFHTNCLKPWLRERNSCPTCRFQLPTDDQQYQARKRARNQSSS